MRKINRVKYLELKYVHDYSCCVYIVVLTDQTGGIVAVSINLWQHQLLDSCCKTVSTGWQIQGHNLKSLEKLTDGICFKHLGIFLFISRFTITVASLDLTKSTVTHCGFILFGCCIEVKLTSFSAKSENWEDEKNHALMYIITNDATIGSVLANFLALRLVIYLIKQVSFTWATPLSFLFELRVKHSLGLQKCLLLVLPIYCTS